MKILKAVSDKDINVIKCPDCNTVFSIVEKDLKQCIFTGIQYVTCAKKKKPACCKNFIITHLEKPEIDLGVSNKIPNYLYQRI